MFGLAAAAPRILERPRVFGSVARGEDRTDTDTDTDTDSDIDLLVELPAGMGMFAVARVQNELEQLLGAPVDLSDGLVFDAERIRLLEIGEAVKVIPPALLATEPGLPWKEHRSDA